MLRRFRAEVECVLIIFRWQVEDRETCLSTFRDLLFPPESTNSPEAGGSTPTTTTKDNDNELDPPVRVLHSPSIRETQAAIKSLREASLCVVEAAQAWRRAKGGEMHQAYHDGAPPTRRSQNGENRESLSGELPSPENTSPRLEEKGGVASLRQCFPIVQQARPTSTTRECDGIRISSGGLPTFLWLGPTSGTATYKSTVSYEASEQERSYGEHNGRTGIITKKIENIDEGGTRETSISASADGKNSYKNGDAQTNITGLNYLARMASDTDWIGGPGSALLDMFPPDTKLYRNPFVLGHNLDDILVVYKGASPRDRERCAYDPDSQRMDGSRSAKVVRLDKQRVRLAAAVIVEEHSMERAGKDGGKRAAGADREALIDGRGVNGEALNTIEGGGKGNSPETDDPPRLASRPRSSKKSGKHSAKKHKKGQISFKDCGDDDGMEGSVGDVGSQLGEARPNRTALLLVLS